MFYLEYFQSFSQFFELEFFMNKVGAISEAVAGLETSVMSGLQFWEDSDESLFGNMDDDEEPAEDFSETKHLD